MRRVFPVTMRAPALLALVLLIGFGTAAQASPIQYTFSYTAQDPCEHWNGCVPSFSFSFDLPDYVTTTGMFALPNRIFFATGTSPDPQSFAWAGTNKWGVWIFGDGAAIGDSSWGGSFGSPILEFVPDYPLTEEGYLTAPTSAPRQFNYAWGATAAGGEGEQFTFDRGTGTLTVTDSTGPEPASLLLLGPGLAVGLRVWRKRRT